MRDRERTKRFVLSDEGSLLVFPLLWSRGFRLRFFFGLCRLCVEYLSFYLLVSIPSDYGWNSPAPISLLLFHATPITTWGEHVNEQGEVSKLHPWFCTTMGTVDARVKINARYGYHFFITSSKTTTCNGAMYFTPSITNCMPVLHVELTLTPNY
jgi:hypothetical protein